MRQDREKMANRMESGEKESVLARYQRIRAWTTHLCEPLEIEDMVVQSMPDVSPTKWHLAHTTWFFETFVLREHMPGYEPMDPCYEVLFNSYYNGVGEQFPRHRRGLVTRPTVKQVFEYRDHVDRHMARLLERQGDDEALCKLVILGLNHEQQHQELLLTDIKHVLSQSPLSPIYRPLDASTHRMPGAPSVEFIQHDGGMVEVGATEQAAFFFDNERPVHQTYLHPFALASRPVTVGDYMAFIEDGGYTRHELWLSQGWSWLDEEKIEAPLYWNLEALRDGEACAFTMQGERALSPDEILTHVSMFEADAFARWSNARLPREHELEWAMRHLGQPEGEANFVESERYHPGPVLSTQSSPFANLFGDVWEWTASSYDAYPGYQPVPGALGEYNGKFMSNQYVLRGGSCATPRDHIHSSYRNFFPSSTRWQFNGLRLAKDRS